MEAFDEIAIREHQRQCDHNRKKMAPGPWIEEPDRVNWKHAGLDCMIVRNHSLFNLCGYVGVPQGHPLFGKDHDTLDASGHGGVNYSGACGGHICHKAQQEVWWFGFDCAHAGDLTPYRTSKEWLKMMEDGAKSLGADYKPSQWWKHDTYRDIAYVTGEVNRLAEQLAGTSEPK